MTTYTHPIRVEFGDCDPAGMVFYPNFYRWFDIATWRMFESVGLDRRSMYRQHKVVGIPLVKSHCRFIRPVMDGDTVTVVSTVDAWHRSSFELSHSLYVTDEIVAEGGETRVWVTADPAGWKHVVAIPVPDTVKALLNQGPDSGIGIRPD